MLYHAVDKEEVCKSNYARNISILHHFPVCFFRTKYSTQHFSVSIVLEREKRGRVWFTGFWLRQKWIQNKLKQNLVREEKHRKEYKQN